MSGESERIIILRREQFGLNHQMRVLGKSPQVYDFRKIKSIDELKEKDYVAGLWFIEGTVANYSFQEKSEKPAVVSAYFERYYQYSCMGGSNSDPQYVAIKSSLEDVDRFAEVLAKKGGQRIVMGLIVNPRKTIEFALEKRAFGLEQKVTVLMALPREEQEREIRNLLSYKAGGKK